MIKKLDQITQRDKVQFSIAGLLMLFGCVMLMIGLFIEPQGVLHSSLLIAFGEIGTLAASVLGIDAIYTNKLQQIVTGMKEMNNAVNEISVIDQPSNNHK